MKIVVISLESALERRAQVTEQLSSIRQPFAFLPAISGKTVYPSPSHDIDEERFLLATGRHATAGEVGCYLSHREAWLRCADSKEPLLIMEDDFALTEDFPLAVSLLEDQVQQFGFIRLQSESRASKTPEIPMGRFTLWRYTKAPNSAMCYGLSPEAAQRLLDESTVIDAPVDVFMREFWRHGQRMYGITPYSVSESDLSPATSISGRLKAKKNLAVRIRRTSHRTRNWWARLNYNLAYGVKAFQNRFRGASSRTRTQVAIERKSVP